MAGELAAMAGLDEPQLREPTPEEPLPPGAERPSVGEVAGSVIPTIRSRFQQAAGGGLEAIGDYYDAPALGLIGKAVGERGRQAELAADPEFMSFWQRAFRDAGVSIGTMGMAAPLGAAGVAGTFGGMSGLETYSRARAAGQDPGDAARVGAINGIIEAGTELVAAKILFKAGTPAFSRLVQFIAADIPGENIATIGQMVNERIADLHPGITAENLLDAIKQTTATAAVAGGVVGGAAGGLHAASRAAERALPPEPTARFEESPATATLPEPTIDPETGMALEAPRVSPPAVDETGTVSTGSGQPESVAAAGDTRDTSLEVPTETPVSPADFTGYLPPGARAEAMAELREGGTPRQVATEVKVAMDTATDRFIVEELDKLHGIQRASIEMGGQRDDGTNEIIDNFRNLQGSRALSQLILEDGTVGWNADGDMVRTGMSLKEALAPAANNMEDFLLYARARRAQELERPSRSFPEGRRSGFTPEAIRAGLDLGTPEIRQAHDRYRALNRRMLNLLRQSERINDTQHAALLDLGDNFVSFQRVMEAVDDRPVQQPGVLGNVLRRYRGGRGQVIDTFDAVTGNIQAMTEMAVQNKARAEFFDLAERSHLGDRFVRRVPNRAVPTTVSVKNVQDTLRRAGVDESAVDAIGNLDAETLTLFQTRPTELQPNQQVVWRNGERQVWEIAPEARALQRSFEAIGPQERRRWLEVFGYPKRVLTNLVTMMPGFQVVNLYRDGAQRYVVSGRASYPYKGLVRGLLDGITQNEVYKEYMRNGGGSVSQRQQEQAQSRARLEDWYGSQGVPMRRVLNTPRKVWGYYQRLLTGFEMANRLAEYRAVRERGGTMRQGTAAGRDVSTDFARSGAAEHIRILNALLPFFNARVQGLYQLARQAGPGQPNRMRRVGNLALRGGVMMAVPSMLLYMMNRQDERWEEIPDEVKDLHWILFNPWGEGYFTIPKPFEVGALFATVPERMLEQALDRDDKLAPAMWRMLVDTLAMNPIPQFGRPIADIWANRRWGGIPIEPKRLQGVEPELRATPGTSQTMQSLFSTEAMRGFQETTLGKAMDLGPAEADHLVKGYLGTLGTYLLQASDALLPLDAGESPDWRIDDMPVVRRWYRELPQKRTAYLDEVYATTNEILQLKQSIDLLKREGGDPSTMVQTPRQQARFSAAGPARQVRDELATVSRQIRIVTRSKQLDGTQKRQLLDQLYAQQSQLARAAVNQGLGNQGMKTRIRAFEELENALDREVSSTPTSIAELRTQRSRTPPQTAAP